VGQSKRVSKGKLVRPASCGHYRLNALPARMRAPTKKEKKKKKKTKKKQFHIIPDSVSPNCHPGPRGPLLPLAAHRALSSIIFLLLAHLPGRSTNLCPFRRSRFIASGDIPRFIRDRIGLHWDAAPASHRLLHVHPWSTTLRDCCRTVFDNRRGPPRAADLQPQLTVFSAQSSA